MGRSSTEDIAKAVTVKANTREIDAARAHANVLWNAVVEGKESSAIMVVHRALASGLSLETVLLEVIGEVQRRIGLEWAADRLSVTQEHAATAINERVIATLSHRQPLQSEHDSDRSRKITVVCVDGEWHSLPARLLTEVLTSRGFLVDYLGTHVPIPHLITHLNLNGQTTVALSSSIATRLPTAHATITACHAIGVPVIVGGAAFGTDGRYARILGADGWAPDARTAADWLSGNPAFANKPLPSSKKPFTSTNVFPHVAHQEYPLVSRMSTQLVKGTLNKITTQFREIADCADMQRQQLAEQLAEIVDYLATALYVDDVDLLGGYLQWAAEIFPAHLNFAPSLPQILDALKAELLDFPHSCELLKAARAH